jgi:hypothetical protein
MEPYKKGHGFLYIILEHGNVGTWEHGNMGTWKRGTWESGTWKRGRQLLPALHRAVHDISVNDTEDYNIKVF